MKRIVSDKAPAALGPYVQAVDTGSHILLRFTIILVSFL